MPDTIKWSYGVTTVPQRRETLLPRTLKSLGLVGFPTPRLFVDGTMAAGDAWLQFNLPLTGRYPAVRLYANWILGLWELYLREPMADRYAMFQDDIEVVKNLREYLDRSRPPLEKGYLNLYTTAAGKAATNNNALIVGKPSGWHLSNQLGKGALALVFDRRGVQTLLSHEHMVHRAIPGPTDRHWRAVDGGVSEAMKQSGYQEWIHNPSLVQHTGVGNLSTIGNHFGADAPTFPGGDFDALTLLP